MRTKGLMLAVALMATIILMLAQPLTAQAVVATSKPRPAQELPYGPYLDELTIYEIGDEMTVLKEIERGNLHAWLWPLRTPEGKMYAAKSTTVETETAYSGCFNLAINPYNTTETTGEFNPFCIREVREALNWYIDREFIVREIMDYFALPHYTVFPPVCMDYQRLYSEMKAIETEYSYDPVHAEEVITQALLDAGCEKIGGKWYYNGKPVTIRFAVRIEDQRKEIGEYIAGELEKLGFTVEIIYCDAVRAAHLTRSYTLTSQGAWHLYTEGWAFTSQFAYGDDLPLWFHYYHPAVTWNWVMSQYAAGDEFEIQYVNLALRLYSAEYTSAEERNEWVLNLTRWDLQDGLRVWLVWEISPFPHHKDLTNLVVDTIGGFYSVFTLRSAKFADRTYGGSAVVGNRRMFCEPWNPVAGSGWLYDHLVFRLIWDYGVRYHPHTGEVIPVRADFTVETAGPGGKLPVPPDAIVPVPVNDSSADFLVWKTAEELGYVNATSAVTFNFHFGKWHHGVDMKLADILAALAHTFRMTNPGDPIYDEEVGTDPYLLAFKEMLKGIKIVDEDTITVYIDYWHIDEGYIAAMASIWTSTPWELYAIMDLVVVPPDLTYGTSGLSGLGKAAYSWTESANRGVEWLDYAKGAETIPAMKSALDALKDVNWIPHYLRRDVVGDWGITTDEASARYSAVESWYNDLKHFMISNGPFYLYSVDIPGKKVVLKAHRGYPFRADHWDWLVVPAIPMVNIKPVPEVVPGMEVTIEATVVKGGEPYGDVTAKLLVFDPRGNLVLTKDMEVKDPAAGLLSTTLTTDETALLVPGVALIMVIVTDLETGFVVPRSAPIIVIPEIAYMERVISDIEARLTSDIAGVESSLSKKISDLESSLSGTLTTVLAVVIVSLVISLASLGLTIRAMRAK